MSLIDITTKEPLCGIVLNYFTASDIFCLSRVCKSLQSYFWTKEILRRYISRYGIDNDYILPDKVDDLFILILFLETKLNNPARKHGAYKRDKWDRNYLTKYSALYSLPEIDQIDDYGETNFLPFSKTKIIEISDRCDYDCMPHGKLSFTSLCEKKELLQDLVGINLGNYTYSFCELTWSPSIDVTLLMETFPNLFFFYFKNGQTQSIIDSITCPNMIYFGIESAGIHNDIIKPLMNSHFPNLFYLELWVGCRERGCKATPDLFQPLWDCIMCPKLKRLDIKNTEEISSYIPFITKSKLIKQLEILDFSLGTLKTSDVPNLIEMIKNSNLKKLIIYDSHIPDDELMPLRDLASSQGTYIDITLNGDDDFDELYISISE